MVKFIYSSPWRVYLITSLLVACSIYVGMSLPVTMFPAASQPQLLARFKYGEYSAQGFMRTFGKNAEAAIRGISSNDVSVETIESSYRPEGAQYQVSFSWGDDPQLARSQLQQVMTAQAASWPLEARQSLHIPHNTYSSPPSMNLEFYSTKLDKHEVYSKLKSGLLPKLSNIPGLDSPILQNPANVTIQITLNPDALILRNLEVAKVNATITQALQSYSGGSLGSYGSAKIINVPGKITTISTLRDLMLNESTQLSDVATVRTVEALEQSLRVNGTSGVLLKAQAKPGGNTKAVLDAVTATVNKTILTIDSSIKVKSIVNPALYIGEAVQNVLHEVIMCALLAVLVMIIFTGSIRSTFTIIIEIPLSLILSFILMKLSGVEINLISLSGLALAVGMNVDGSVVVMENILRRTSEHQGLLSPKERLNLITTAVREVAMPVFISTVTALIVFAPLAFTSQLTYMILGDLAKAVVFSHGLSFFVAMLLVPTIRLHLLNVQNKSATTTSPQKPSMLRRMLDQGVPNAYAALLRLYLSSQALRWTSYLISFALLVSVLVLLTPKIRQEIIGKANTSIIIIRGNSNELETIEAMQDIFIPTMQKLRTDFPQWVSYSFSQVSHNRFAWGGLQLKDKRTMPEAMAKMEQSLGSTGPVRWQVIPYNPSQLVLPNPADFEVIITSSNYNIRTDLSNQVIELIRASKLFHSSYATPGLKGATNLNLTFLPLQWEHIKTKGIGLSQENLVRLISMTNSPHLLGNITQQGETLPIYASLPKQYSKDYSHLGALPIAMDKTIVPLRALVHMQATHGAKKYYRKDLVTMNLIKARLPVGLSTKEKKIRIAKAKDMIANFKKQALSSFSNNKERANISLGNPQKLLHSTLKELAGALIISSILVFIVLLLQLGSLIYCLLVMLAIPFGAMGVIIALYATGAPLSINSILGVILLGGIAVANSLLLIDATKRELKQTPDDPLDAIIRAAKTRIRPILMTSLATILGMLPIAIGIGDGGKIVQPLGIAVCGGLWVSLLFTLMLVPSLTYAYISRQSKKSNKYLAATS